MDQQFYSFRSKSLIQVILHPSRSVKRWMIASLIALICGSATILYTYTVMQVEGKIMVLQFNHNAIEKHKKDTAFSPSDSVALYRATTDSLKQYWSFDDNIQYERFRGKSNMWRQLGFFLCFFFEICICVIIFLATAERRSGFSKAVGEVQEKVIKNPDKPALAWELASIKLEDYLSRNLSQVQWIFFLTLVVMLGGFVIIAYGIMIVYRPKPEINAAIVATTSGIVVEFIAGTFLLIYRSTMQQAKDYVTVLERINAVGMSMQIADNIEKDPLLKDQTRAEIAKLLLTLYSVDKKKDDSKKKKINAAKSD